MNKSLYTYKINFLVIKLNHITNYALTSSIKPNKMHNIYVREKYEDKMIRDELSKLLKYYKLNTWYINEYIDHFMILYNSKYKIVVTDIKYDLGYERMLYSFFECRYETLQKITINKEKIYGCDDKCNKCIMCLCGYTVKNEKTVKDDKHYIYHIINMRKELLCLPLVSMILARFNIPKDIRKYICSFLRKSYPKK